MVLAPRPHIYEVISISEAGGNVQKACPRGGGEAAQQGRESLARSRRGSPLFDERSVLPVREHGKMARTPLVAFCNIPLRHGLDCCF